MTNKKTSEVVLIQLKSWTRLLIRPRKKDPVLINTTNEVGEESKDGHKELQDSTGNEKESKKVASSAEHENKDLKQDQVILTDTGKKSPVTGTEREKDKCGSTESRNKTEVSKTSQIREKEN